MVTGISNIKPAGVQLIFSPDALDLQTREYFIQNRLTTRSAAPAAISPLGGNGNELSEGGGELQTSKTGAIGTLAVKLELLLSYLKEFQIEQIELWISGVTETTGLLNLAISAKGEGGIKVTLKPKS